jgi:serine phosphatase RsbU (regulator of sigma subunit)
MAKANETIMRFSAPEVFVTVVMALVDKKRKRLVFCSAGHPPAMLLSGGRVMPLRLVGPLLGAFPDVGYQQGSVEFARGDTLVMYTDGVTEARRGPELYGEERLMGLLARLADRPLEEIPEAIVSALEDWGEIRDDLALLLARMV